MKIPGFENLVTNQSKKINFAKIIKRMSSNILMFSPQKKTPNTTQLSAKSLLFKGINSNPKPLIIEKETNKLRVIAKFGTHKDLTADIFQNSPLKKQYLKNKKSIRSISSRNLTGNVLKARKGGHFAYITNMVFAQQFVIEDSELS